MLTYGMCRTQSCYHSSSTLQGLVCVCLLRLHLPPPSVRRVRRVRARRQSQRKILERTDEAADLFKSCQSRGTDGRRKGRSSDGGGGGGDQASERDADMTDASRRQRRFTVMFAAFAAPQQRRVKEEREKVVIQKSD